MKNTSLRLQMVIISFLASKKALKFKGTIWNGLGNILIMVPICLAIRDKVYRSLKL